MKNIFIAGLLSLFILQSCSIEKRRYTGGFHIERHHASPSLSKHVHDESESAALMDTDAELTAENHTILPSKGLEKNACFSTCEKHQNATSKKNLDLKRKIVSTEKKNVDTYFVPFENNVLKIEDSLKRNTNATSSVVFSVLAWVFRAIQFIAVTSGQITFEASLLTLLAPGAILAFMAFAFAAVAMKTMNSHPGIYSNRTDAINGGGLALAYLYQFAMSLLFYAFLLYTGLILWM